MKSSNFLNQIQELQTWSNSDLWDLAHGLGGGDLVCSWERIDLIMWIILKEEIYD